MLKHCSYCHTDKPLSSFGKHDHKGKVVVYAKCRSCRPRENRATRRYRQTKKGKANATKNRKSAAGLAVRAAYRRSEKGRATMKRWRALHSAVAWLARELCA